MSLGRFEQAKADTAAAERAFRQADAEAASSIDYPAGSF